MKFILFFPAMFFSMTVCAFGESWSTKINHPVYKPDTTVAATAVMKYMSLQETDLKALITKDGGKGINVTMKQAAYDMARLYQKTGKPEYADKAVLLLERFAEVVPQWPLIDRSNGNPIPLNTVDWGDWNNSGLWGIWYHQDLEQCVQIPLAYDFIASSGALERESQKTGKDVREFIEKNLLRYMVELNLKNSYLLRVCPPLPEGRAPFDFSNMGGNRINGIIPFGKVFEPEYIHMAVDWMRLFTNVMYFRDGIWHEATPSYHLQITNRLNLILPDLLKGYSDPPGYAYKDGTRYDDLDVRKGIEDRFARMQAALDHLTLPDDFHTAIHDTHSNQRAWYVSRDFSDSYCYFGMRHAVMGRFKGSDQVQAYLHFGGTDGHEHYDCLNMGLWALGGELFSEGEYNRFGNASWNISSAGHNLVVVNGTNQKDRFAGQFTVGPDDAIEGLSYNPCNYGHGNTRNFGNLRLWDPTHPSLQVVEAEGENAYYNMNLYRRTVVMAEIEKTSFYLIDIFRVKGGNTLDWMLHGQLFEDYSFWSNLNLKPASGKRFDYLNIHQQAIADSTWSSEFQRADGARIRTTMLSWPGTEVSSGRAPAMRRTGDATFLDVRRTGGNTAFAAVHEPYRGAPKIKSITPLLYSGKADSVVCIKIELEGGRTDYFASTLDSPPYPEYKIPGADFSFRGRLVHVAEQNGKLLWMYLLEGGAVSRNGVVLAAKSGDISYRGQVQDIKRIEKGDSWNGFITTEPLPDDGSLTGKTLLLTLGDSRTEGYTIAKIVKQGGTTQIQVNEEPGLELRDNGRLAKLVYFPWHGVRGDIKFQISGSVYRDSEGNIQTTAPLEQIKAGINSESPFQSGAFELNVNYPNPFNPTTTIQYTLNEPKLTRLEIYSSLGQKVRTLVNGIQAAGKHAVQWDGKNEAGKQAASGLYLYRLESGSFVQTKKMVLME